MRALSRAFAALVTVGLAATGVATLASCPALAEPGTIVISQVYGGGGSAGAPLTNDYVELFNRSAAPVALDGWSVQYASATGTGNFGANPVVPLAGTLAPGQYHLLQLAGGAVEPTPTPTPTVEPTVEPTPTPTPTGEPCEIPVTHQIAQVQGSGDAGPLAGQVVRVEGVVTADFQETNQLSGFFFQPDAFRASDHDPVIVGLTL
ncbi:lamin tail domain-containing protein [Streptosporangium sp. NBC_01755]|uniref:lamin tail domain-containing protein n=1 Tax=unclassified Streptosporangium TaxID=2632669 RepID=UPI002DDA67C3|nr:MULTISPECIES: lamin tail domain-containing protein [unclassified Streptosporangium]WSA28062.1 lamin tail domain-containing protein [Streptosporangium sp. NBC_01810]WSD00465.1 lamin tail domain-containing protein [Streptosporangium sp. NBC_01755]